MLAIIVPAHNEEAHIAACLRSVKTAAQDPQLLGEEVHVIVVADACRDRTRSMALHLNVRVVEVEARNVGVAREAGARAAISLGARWLAFTDADSVVAPDWLAAQLSQKADAVCGTVTVNDWGVYGEAMRRHFEHTYIDANGHAHIHGANFGVSTHAYEAAGGFPDFETGEDVALVAALRASGASICWSCAPRVITSSRKNFRAPAGFGATLARVGALQLQVAALAAGGTAATAGAA